MANSVSNRKYNVKQHRNNITYISELRRGFCEGELNYNFFSECNCCSVALYLCGGSTGTQCDMKVGGSGTGDYLLQVK